MHTLRAVDPTTEENGELLARALVKLGPEQAIYLAGVGWLQMKRARPYQGRGPSSDPDKYFLAYFTDPDLYHRLWAVPPEPREFATERDRFLAWIHGWDRDFDPSLEDPRIVVSRFPWPDAVALELQRRLLDVGTLSIPHVGIFEIVDGDRGRVARFRVAKDLEPRLQVR